MRRTFVLAAGIATLLATSVANAGFVVNCPGTVNSVGPVGDAGNGICNFNYAGPEFTVGNLVFEGDLANGGTGTWANEARFNVQNPTNNPAGGGNTPQLTATTTFGATIHIGPTAINAAGFFSGTTIGNWRFEAFESYDDPGTDGTWSNLRIEVQDFAAPPPPPVDVDLGTIGTGTTSGSAPLSPGVVRWFKFTTTVPIAAPDWLTATTAGSNLPGGLAPNDTEIGIYNTAGVLLTTNDDISFPADATSQVNFGTPPAPVGGTPVATLPAGVYYAAVSSYNTVFNAGFAVTSTGTTSGTVQININTNVPEPATLALLAFGAVALIRRRS